MLHTLPFTQSIIQSNGKIYLVGGYVRDQMLGLPSKDIDVIVTGIPLNDLEMLLSTHGKVNLVGKSFGIIKFGDIDVAVPRTEKKTHDGHTGFSVEYDHNLPIEVDLGRRDFTINSMATDLDSNLVDPFNGKSDIERKLIRMTSPSAFPDDPLRMLRGIQFASRFRFDIEGSTMLAIQENAHRIKEISGERILMEFQKIIDKGDMMVAGKLLVESGLYSYIFTGAIDYSIISKSKTMGEFLFGLNCSAEFYRDVLKGDLNVYHELMALEMGSQFNGDKRCIFNMYKVCSTVVNTSILGDLFTETVAYMVEHNIPFSLKQLKINGNDLMKVGLKGPQIGLTLNAILNEIFKGNLMNDHQDILNYVATLND